jgi:hypothetical protein
LLATGGFLGITLGTIGAAAFGAFQGCIGKLIYEHGMVDKIAVASHTLVNKVIEENRGTSDIDDESCCSLNTNT